jgi:hypothetical protein
MSDDYLDLDRSELGDGLVDETKDELAELALARMRATGRIVAVSTMTGSDRATVYDETIPEGVSVPLLEPSPSLAHDVVDELDDEPELDE